MTTRPRYLLDANVFIEAKRRYYAFDICPGFWLWLRAAHGEGRVVSIDRVRKELEAGKDDLWSWVEQQLPEDCFAPTDDFGTVEHFGGMVAWVQGQAQYLPQAKADFAAKPDGWLAAYGRAHSMILVTHEERARRRQAESPAPQCLP
ncbi:MAG TPA: DUF4411 family protein [Vicinamibacteria bacterium]|nr:DUF4411 family protein [Vicinamibacteria bacterium]